MLFLKGTLFYRTLCTLKYALQNNLNYSTPLMYTGFADRWTHAPLYR